MTPGTYMVAPEHEPRRARYPVVDAHNHLWGAWDAVGGVVRVMDAVGVACYCDLTANMAVRWVQGGYAFEETAWEGFPRAVEPYPNRFYGFTAATFSGPVERPLVRDWAEFVGRTVDRVRRDVGWGARGLKILKEVGLRYRDSKGDLVRLDDERLGPVWEACGELGIPVLMHQADPDGFFDAVTPANEHYDSLRKYPTWSFCDPVYPRKAELLARRNRVIQRHPRTTFLLPHVANRAEDLSSVGRLLDEHANVMIDISARCDELGRRPYGAREFVMRYQDRILFGTDMPASEAMYRFCWRFLETFDEYIVPPDYDGTFGRHRWRVCGLGLPDDVLRKLYFGNALRAIPGLREDYEAATGAVAEGTTKGERA